MQQFDVAIVGGGHAGAQAAIALRQRGFAGTLAIVGEEAELPYERPPLSKDFLAGDKEFERMLLRPQAFWDEREVAMLGGRRGERVDPSAHVLQCGDGSRFSYGTLIWATGGRARRLACPGAELGGQHVVRNHADVVALKAALDGGARRVVIVGGGYIGLETAAVLVKQGHSVTVIEAMTRLLARVAGPEIGDFYAERHRAAGVDVRLATSVAALEGTEGQVTGVMLADNEVVPADVVVVGIGIEPEAEALLSAGAQGADCSGVRVDEFCRTSLADVFAIGDVAAHANAFADGAVIRLESVQNANDMASVVAKGLTGETMPYHAVPWFWSNQYDLRLQTVGLSMGHDGAVLRGEPSSGAFSLVYLRGQRVVALDCVNMVRDYVQGKALIERGIEVDPATLADTAITLKSLLPG